MLQALRDESLSEAAFTRAGELVESVRDSLSPWREPPERTRAFTSELIERSTRDHGVGEVATTSRATGTVKWFSDTRGYGFIDGDSGTQYFVHFSVITGSGYRCYQRGSGLLS